MRQAIIIYFCFSLLLVIHILWQKYAGDQTPIHPYLLRPFKQTTYQWFLHFHALHIAPIIWIAAFTQYSREYKLIFAVFITYQLALYTDFLLNFNQTHFRTPAAYILGAFLLLHAFYDAFIKSK